MRPLPLVLGLLLLGGCGDGPADRSNASGDSTAREAALRPAAWQPPDVQSICDTINNSFRCARAVESRQLPRSERAMRRGDTLFLALESGDTMRLEDEGSERRADQVVYYSYQDHWPDPGFFVVHRQYYEGSEFVLVQDSTGRRTGVPDRPLRSPNGHRFAVLSLDLVAGYGPNVLQIWELDEGQPERAWETEPSQWGPRSGRWADSTTLRFVQHGYCDELGGSGRRMCDREAVLRRTGDEWHLEAEADGG